MTDDPRPPEADGAPAPDAAPGTPDTPDVAVLAGEVALRAAVLELERHAARGGWDQPAQLFALVLTEELLAAEPGLAPMLEIDPDADLTGSLTPIEQEPLPADRPLEEVLTEVVWPEEVHGTAVVVERIVLPPSVEDLPEDPEEAQAFAAGHPERQEVRMVVAATRAGAAYAALRLRSHDDDQAVVEGRDLVPALLQLLQATLVQEPGGLRGADEE